MCREMHRVMGEEGPSHTTLFRHASGRVKRPHVLVERYLQQAIDKLTAGLSQKQDSPKRKRQRPESRSTGVQGGGACNPRLRSREYRATWRNP